MLEVIVIPGLYDDLTEYVSPFDEYKYLIGSYSASMGPVQYGAGFNTPHGVAAIDSTFDQLVISLSRKNMMPSLRRR